MMGVPGQPGRGRFLWRQREYRQQVQEQEQGCVSAKATRKRVVAWTAVLGMRLLSK